MGDNLLVVLKKNILHPCFLFQTIFKKGKWILLKIPQ